MVEFIFVTLIIAILFIIKSHYASITTIYFSCITIYELLFVSHNDAIACAFAVIIPLIGFICSIWVYNREHILYYPKLFFISMVLFAFCAVKAFCATDALSMFIYMETSMIPMALMMLSENKCKHTSVIYQYLTYTFISACLLLVAIIQINIDSKSYSFVPTKEWCYWLIALAAAIKLPMFPFHYWVSTVHGKSSTICSIMLASVCLKYSALMIVRFLLPIPSFMPYIILTGIISAVCSQYRQTNLKIIFAYSSIIHMNMYLFIPFVMPDSFWFIFSLIAHSITMLLAFLITDIINKRKVISNKTWILVLISSLYITSIPGSPGFIAEMCTLYHSNNASPPTTAIMLFCIIVSSYRTMKFVFEREEHVNNYNLFKLSKPQNTAVTLTILLITISGIMPFYISLFKVPLRLF